MSDVAAWLVERAERVESSGEPFGNVYGRALREAAEAWDAEAASSPAPQDAAP